MTTYIMTGKYTVESVRQISGARTAKGSQIIRQCGGKLRTAYATMGKTDLVAIVEFPGVREAMKASVALTRAMGISFATVPALPVEDFDKLVGSRS